jgi:sulfite exporter TauE/SafE
MRLLQICVNLRRWDALLAKIRALIQLKKAQRARVTVVSAAASGMGTMEASQIGVLAGAALGIASTLHCAGMCGAIASSLMFCSAEASLRGQLRTLALTHLGRITAYAMAGAAVGAAGSTMIAWLDRDLAFRMLQWAGAVALMWIGLSTAGLVPALSGLDRVLAPVSSTMTRVAGSFGGRSPPPFLAGLAWGLLPCAMVYGALFTAMMSGSAFGGALVMAGFGAGTLPGLITTAFGVRTLARAELRPRLRALVGITISLFGFMTVWTPHGLIAALCR